MRVFGLTHGNVTQLERKLYLFLYFGGWITVLIDVLPDLLSFVGTSLFWLFSSLCGASCKLRWCEAVKARVWSLGVVVDPPCFDDFAGFGQASEQMLVG